MQYFNTWEFIAGLGIFLFGMLQMEDAIKSLAGRSFKLFLRKHSKSKLKGILSGAGVTAILQSSSVVSLIVLAFVGAGAIQLKQAIAMVFGANLGTTITGWLVAMVGFKVDIELLAFPLIAVGSLMMVMLTGKDQWRHLGQAFLGLGFLFLGLEFMKTSVGHLADNLDLAPFVDYPPLVFLIIGVVLTAIIQSSSASMVITLSALYNDIIPLDSAAAMVIGSDLGTTVTVLIGGMTGLPAKKRVAMAHFIFNLVTDTLAFLGLGWLLGLIELINVQDPLFALVLLHSSFNALGLVLFYPFINLLADFLEKRFRDITVRVAKHICNLTPEVPDAAIQALNAEVQHLSKRVLSLVEANFEAYPADTFSFEIHRTSGTSQAGFKEQYKAIKQLEGEMFEFYTKLQQQPLESSENNRLTQLITSIRFFLHSAKEAKDIHKDLWKMNNSTHEILNKLFLGFKEGNLPFFRDLKQLMEEPDSPTSFEDLVDLLQKNQNIYEDLLQGISRDLSRKRLTQIEISTVLNVNRELYSSRKALILAAKDFLLNFQESVDFQNLPLTAGS